MAERISTGLILKQMRSTCKSVSFYENLATSTFKTKAFIGRFTSKEKSSLSCYTLMFLSLLGTQMGMTDSVAIILLDFTLHRNLRDF